MCTFVKGGGRERQYHPDIGMGVAVKTRKKVVGVRVHNVSVHSKNEVARMGQNQ